MPTARKGSEREEPERAALAPVLLFLAAWPFGSGVREKRNGDGKEEASPPDVGVLEVFAAHGACLREGLANGGERLWSRHSSDA